MQSNDTAPLPDQPPPTAVAFLNDRGLAEVETATELRRPRPLNYRFAAILLAVIVALAVAITSLHAYQMRRLSASLLEQAERARTEGRLKTAARHLSQYLGFVPGDRAAREQLARVLDEGAENPRERFEVLQLYEAILRDEADNTPLRRRVAQLNLQLGRVHDAAAQLSSLIQDSPADAELHSLLARCHDLLGKLPLAADAYQAAIAAEPRRVDDYERLAWLLHGELDRPGEASAVLDRLVVANPQSAPAYAVRAAYRQAHGDIEGALIDAHRAFQLDPADPDVLYLSAQLLAQQRQVAPATATATAPSATGLGSDEVRRRIEQRLSQGPDSQLDRALAQLDLLAGRVDQAEQHIRAGLQAAPENVELLWMLCDLLLAQGRTSEAQSQLARLRELNPPPPADLVEYLEARLAMAGGAHLAASRRLEAIRADAVNQPELETQVNLHLARCYQQIGHSQQRLEAFRRVIDTSPASVEGRIGLAQALADAGRIDDALVHLRQVLHVDGVARLLAELLIRRNLQLAEPQRDWSEVEQLLNQPTRSGTDEVQLLLLRARLLETRQDTQSAADLFDRAAQRFPGRPEVWTALARFQLRSGDAGAAEKTLDAAETQLGGRRELLVARIELLATLETPDADRRLDELLQELNSRELPADDPAWRSLAQAYASIDAYPKASAVWTRIAAATPDAIDVWLERFDLALRHQDAAATEECVAQMQRIEGAEGAYWRLSRARALLAASTNDDLSRLTEARSLLDAIAGRLVSSPLVPLSLAQIDELSGMPDAALEDYLAAIDRGAADPQLAHRTVELLCRQHRYEEAEQVLQKFSQLNLGSLPDGFSRLSADIAVQTRGYEAALELARQAVASRTASVDDYVWLGRMLQGAGHTAEAEQAYRDAIALDATESASWLALIALFTSTGHHAEAAQLVSELQTHVTGDDALLVLARSSELVDDDGDAAWQYYARALETQPHSVIVLGAAADYQFRHGQLDQCEILLRRLLEADAEKPTSAAYAARRTLALVLAMRSGFGDFREALALLEQNLQDGGHRLEDLRAKAKLLATRPIRKYQREAISVLLALDDIAPLNPTDQLQLVHLYLDVGHWPHARDSLLALLANHNDHPDVLAFAVRTLLDHGEPAGPAPQWLTRLEELEPDSHRTRALRVRLLVARSEFDQALQVLNQAVERDDADPDSNDGLNWLAAAAADLALALDRSGRTVIAQKFASAAETLYRRLMQAQPEQVLALARFMGRQWRLREALDLCQQAWEAAPPEQVAVVCVELLRSGRASADDCSLVRGWLESAVARQPDSGELSFQLANVAHVQHDFRSAEQFYRRTIELAPWSILAYNELALLLALQDTGRQDALDLVERAIELSGPRDFLLDTRATVRLALGQTDLALQDLEEAIADSPTPAKYFHLAQLHLERNDRAAADAAYRQGLAAGLHADALHPLERPTFDKIHATLQQF